MDGLDPTGRAQNRTVAAKPLRWLDQGRQGPLLTKKPFVFSTSKNISTSKIDFLVVFNCTGLKKLSLDFLEDKKFNRAVGLFTEQFGGPENP